MAPLSPIAIIRLFTSWLVGSLFVSISRMSIIALYVQCNLSVVFLLAHLVMFYN